MHVIKYLFSLLVISICPGYAQTVGVDHLVAEPAYSTIEFSVPIANGLTRVTGKFTVFNIDLDLVDNDMTKSRVKAVIKVNSLITGNSSRDRVLMSDIFFDAKKFPEIVFVSEKIVKNGNGYLAIGQFQMHGITRPMELPFIITGTKENGVMGIKCRYSILRSAYQIGMEYRHANYDNFLENEVGIEIDFWTKFRPRGSR